MKKILLIFVCLCCMFISCSKDDSVQEPVFVENELVQTTWSGCQYLYNDKDEIKETIEDFKVDFQNANEAIYIDSVGYSSWSIGECGVQKEYLDIGHLLKKHEIEWYCKPMLQKRVP